MHEESPTLEPGQVWAFKVEGCFVVIRLENPDRLVPLWLTKPNKTANGWFVNNLSDGLTPDWMHGATYLGTLDAVAIERRFLNENT